MKSKKAVSAASYPSRIFKNDVTIKCPGCMVLCSGGCLTVAANSKNKETTTSLFFSRRQRSEVMFPLHENPSLWLDSQRKLLPMVAIW